MSNNDDATIAGACVDNTVACVVAVVNKKIPKKYNKYIQFQKWFLRDAIDKNVIYKKTAIALNKYFMDKNAEEQIGYFQSYERFTQEYKKKTADEFVRETFALLVEGQKR